MGQDSTVEILISRDIGHFTTQGYSRMSGLSTKPKMLRNTELRGGVVVMASKENVVLKSGQNIPINGLTFLVLGKIQ